MPSRSRLSPTKTGSGSRISFQRRAKQSRPSPPPAGGCGGGESYCVDSDQYPSDSIMSVIRQDSTLTVRLFQEVFNSKCVGQDSLIKLKFLPQEEPLCDSRARVVLPKVVTIYKSNLIYNLI